MEPHRPIHPKIKPLNPKQAGLQASFSEPVYERLALREGDAVTTILAFVRPTNADLRHYLRTIGASPSERFTAGCYREIWELPPRIAANRNLSELDLCVASGLNILDGRFPHTAGYWAQQDSCSEKMHWTSRLLALSQRSQSVSP